MPGWLDTLDIWQKRRANKGIAGWLSRSRRQRQRQHCRKHNEVKNMIWWGDTLRCGGTRHGARDVQPSSCPQLCCCLLFFAILFIFFIFPPVFFFYYLLWFTVERLIWFSSGSHARPQNIAIDHLQLRLPDKHGPPRSCPRARSAPAT